MIRVDQEVYVKSVGCKGKVIYVDFKYLFKDLMYPVQVQLEKPYYDDDYEVSQPNAYMYRTGLKDLEW